MTDNVFEDSPPLVPQKRLFFTESSFLLAQFALPLPERALLVTQLGL